MRSPNPDGNEAADRGRTSAVAERVRVLDTTLRDGEQSAGVVFSARDKVEIASALDRLGVDVIEAGFPSSDPTEADAVAQVAAAVKDASVCALSGAVERDIDTTWQALRAAVRPRLHIVLSSSEIHITHQLRKRRDEIEDQARRCIAHARRHTSDVEFSLMDATRSDPAFVVRLVRTAVRAGATTVNLPDTVGAARPEQVAELFRRVRAQVPEVAEAGRVLSFHGQDDLGMATANALAAIGAGARQVEVAVNGIGERAGNTSLEEVVVALRIHGPELGVYTGVDTRGLCALSRIVEERSGMPVPPNKAVVGRNAFRHASGLHQDGVLKHPETFELIDPREVGHPTGSQIVLGKLSGRAGFRARVRELGLELAGEDLERAFARFKRVAAQRSEVHDDELREICEQREVAAEREVAAQREVGAQGVHAREAWPGPGV